jgi:uncharacterized protein YdiU (UPF0061 family)
MIGEWNLTRFAESLLSLIDSDQSEAIKIASQCLDEYQTKFRDYWLGAMKKKLGIFNVEPEDLVLVEDLLMLMYKHQADYTNTFRNINKPSQLNERLFNDAGFHYWMINWNERLSRQTQSISEAQALMDQHNPLVIPRNHLVEEALEEASKGDVQPFHELLNVLLTPYVEPKDAKYLSGPDPNYDIKYRTFCGT